VRDWRGLKADCRDLVEIHGVGHDALSFQLVKRPSRHSRPKPGCPLLRGSFVYEANGSERYRRDLQARALACSPTLKGIGSESLQPVDVTVRRALASASHQD